LLSSHLQRLRPTANCLAVATLGALAASFLGVPAPWICGALVALAAAALMGLKVGVVKWLRDLTFVVIGYSMGAGVTPDMLEKLALWPASLLFLLLCVGATTGLLAFILQRGFGWDRATASFASVPGAFSYLMAVAAHSHANVGRIAVAQVSRLVVLAALAPSLVTLLPSPETALPPPAPHEAAPLWELLLALAASGLGGLLAIKLRVPAGALIGSLVTSMLLHATAVTTAELPPEVLIPGFVVTGAFVGSRVRDVTVSQVLRDAKAGLLTVMVALVLSGVFAFLASWLLDLPLSLLWLSYAPGGLEVMVIMALALELDPTFVGAHHIVRYLFLSLTIPIVFRKFLKRAD
jgi:membrane AbrB-like protein